MQKKGATSVTPYHEKFPDINQAKYAVSQPNRSTKVYFIIRNYPATSQKVLLVAEFLYVFQPLIQFLKLTASELQLKT